MIFLLFTLFYVGCKKIQNKNYSYLMETNQADNCKNSFVIPKNIYIFKNYNR